MMNSNDIKNKHEEHKVDTTKGASKLNAEKDPRIISNSSSQASQTEEDVSPTSTHDGAQPGNQVINRSTSNAPLSVAVVVSTTTKFIDA